MSTIKCYHTDIHDFTVSSGEVKKDSYEDDYVVGVSLGSLAILESASYLKGKIVLINPPILHRSLTLWLSRWSVYIFGGLFVERQIFILNPYAWVHALRRAYVLLTTDFSSTIDALPKDRVVVIRSKQDTFFCDKTAVAYLRSHGVHVIEIEGGHNWNIYTEDEMNRQCGM